MIRDFDASRRVVLAGGRRFVCRPPTVRTVDRAMAMFEPEILALHAAAREVPLTAGEVLRVVAGDRRMAEVLDTCVEVWGGAPGELVELTGGNRELQVELAQAVLELCNPGWICATLHLDDVLEAPDEVPAVTDEPTTQDAVVCRIAAAFGRPPHEVIDWPYAVFVRALQLGYGSDLSEPAPDGGAKLTLQDLEA